MVNKQRLIDEFLELVQIDSPSSKEGKDMTSTNDPVL